MLKRALSIVTRISSLDISGERKTVLITHILTIFVEDNFKSCLCEFLIDNDEIFTSNDLSIDKPRY